MRPGVLTHGKIFVVLMEFEFVKAPLGIQIKHRDLVGRDHVGVRSPGLAGFDSGQNPFDRLVLFHRSTMLRGLAASTLE